MIIGSPHPERYYDSARSQRAVTVFEVVAKHLSPAARGSERGVRSSRTHTIPVGSQLAGGTMSGTRLGPHTEPKTTSGFGIGAWWSTCDAAFCGYGRLAKPPLGVALYVTGGKLLLWRRGCYRRISSLSEVFDCPWDMLREADSLAIAAEQRWILGEILAYMCEGRLEAVGPAGIGGPGIRLDCPMPAYPEYPALKQFRFERRETSSWWVETVHYSGMSSGPAWVTPNLLVPCGMEWGRTPRVQPQPGIDARGGCGEDFLQGSDSWDTRALSVSVTGGTATVCVRAFDLADKVNNCVVTDWDYVRRLGVDPRGVALAGRTSGIYLVPEENCSGTKGLRRLSATRGDMFRMATVGDSASVTRDIVVGRQSIPGFLREELPWWSRVERLLTLVDCPYYIPATTDSGCYLSAHGRVRYVRKEGGPREKLSALQIHELETAGCVTVVDGVLRTVPQPCVMRVDDGHMDLHTDPEALYNWVASGMMVNGDTGQPTGHARRRHAELEALVSHFLTTVAADPREDSALRFCEPTVTLFAEKTLRSEVDDFGPWERRGGVRLIPESDTLEPDANSTHLVPPLALPIERELREHVCLVLGRLAKAACRSGVLRRKRCADSMARIREKGRCKVISVWSMKLEGVTPTIPSRQHPGGIATDAAGAPVWWSWEGNYVWKPGLTAVQLAIFELTSMEVDRAGFLC